MISRSMPGSAPPSPGKASRILCIAGTGTDVGKSVVTAGLLRLFASRGLQVQAVKAVQTGCEGAPPGYGAPDVALYKDACPTAEAFSLENFEPPCSPHLAARMAQREIQIDSLLQGILSASSRNVDLTLVEGAGGLFVPLNDHECLIDLFARLRAPLVLVAANALGAINHVLLCLEALRARNIGIARVVLTTTAPLPRGNTLAALIGRDNADIIARQGKIAPPLCLPYVPGLRGPASPQREAAWTRLASCLALLAVHYP